MDRNPITLAIARRVILAMSEAGSDILSVSQAADITTSQLEDRLSGRADFQLDELVLVGGFLHVPAYRFMEVAA